ncbi:MAG: hypothetical protein M1818_000059 [Claussenomyces sp. TS43310]|nr:MAG: hypothetical protein M1818_000059 [Claussenomyces sp. TS43310]
MAKVPRETFSLVPMELTGTRAFARTSQQRPAQARPSRCRRRRVDLVREAFKRQLEVGHSAYIFVDPELGSYNFGGLHHVLPDGVSGRHYWMFMQPDPKVAKPDHWVQTASQQEKLDHVLKSVAKLPPKFREIFESTPASGIKEERYISRDLELNSLPAGRIVLVDNAAHAMTPFWGEGGAEYSAAMLERGSEAVRNSRNEQSAGKTKDRKSKFVSANQEAKPLSDETIVLEAENRRENSTDSDK